jgi:hypothetical protein
MPARLLMPNVPTGGRSGVAHALGVDRAPSAIDFGVIDAGLHGDFTEVSAIPAVGAGRPSPEYEAMPGTMGFSPSRGFSRMWDLLPRLGRFVCHSSVKRSRWRACSAGSGFDMVKALARAFRWRKLLETGTYGTVEELAAEDQPLLRQPHPPDDASGSRHC